MAITKAQLKTILKENIPATNMGINSTDNQNVDPRAEYACYNRKPLPASGSGYDRPLLYEVNMYSRSPIMGDDEDSQQFFLNIEKALEDAGEMTEWNQEYNEETYWWHVYGSVEVENAAGS